MTARRAWILFWVLFAAISISTLTYDFRCHPKVTGDQASHLLQALSLAHDGDLKFDEGDLAVWKNVGWEPIPNGLFYQLTSSGFAFAKPYLYSLWLAPFVKIFGAPLGVAVANWLVLAVVALLSIRILQMYYSGATVPLVATAFYCVSYFYMYLFAIEPATFHAMLVTLFCWLALQQAREPRNWRVFAAAALLAVCLPEKVSLGLLLGPMFIFMLTRPGAPWIKAPALFGALYFLLLLPYLHYSDWRSATPYGGERYYCRNRMPFTEQMDLQKIDVPHNTGKSLNLIKQSLESPTNLLKSFYFYFFGGYSGMLIFAPAVFLLFLLGTAAVLRSRDGWALAMWIGILLCISGYILLYPTNYYGGGQTVGNRWFVKMIPAILSLAIAAQVTPKAARVASYFGLFLGTLFLYRHHVQHRDAFANPAIIGEVQRFFPLETNQAMMPQFTSMRRVNIRLYPRTPIWRCLPKTELPALKWTDLGPCAFESETIKRFDYVRTGREPAYFVLHRGDDYQLYTQGGQQDYTKTFCSSLGKKLSLIVKCEEPLYLHVWSAVGKTSCTITSGAQQMKFDTSRILKLTNGKNQWSRIDMTGVDEFLLAPEPAAEAEARDVPKLEVTLNPREWAGN